MKKIFIVLLTVLLIGAVGVGAYFIFWKQIDRDSDTFTVPKEYVLEFEDEFIGGYDEEYWGPSGITVRRGGYWSPDQVFTKNGKLHIRTEYKENGEESGYYTGDLCWPTKRITYGYYEIRCKVENVRGVWQAFWLMPDDIYNLEQKAQDGSEIDIFESAIPYTLQNALYYDGYKGRKNIQTQTNDIYDGYHTYALDWKKDGMYFYYDGYLTWELTDPDLICAHPAYLNITSEINGSVKDGKPNPGHIAWIGNGSIEDEDNILPSDFIVDYVRIYDNGDLIWSEKE